MKAEGRLKCFRKRPYRILLGSITIWSFLLNTVSADLLSSPRSTAISPPSRVCSIIKDKGGSADGFRDGFSWVYFNRVTAKALELNKGAGELREEIEQLERLRGKGGLGPKLSFIEKRDGFYIACSKNSGEGHEILHYFLKEAHAKTTGYFVLPLDTKGAVYCESISGQDYGEIQKRMVPVAFSTNGGCERQIIEAIQEARGKIDIAVYNFDNEEIFKALLDTQKKNTKTEKVEIRMIVDKSSLKRMKKMIGEKSLSDKKLIEYFKNRGLALIVDKRKSGLMHNKFMIVDDKLVVTGSYNWTESSNENRENTIALSYIAAFQDYFNWLWSEKTRSPPNIRPPPFGIRALFSPRGGCYDEVMRLIAEVSAAKKAHPEHPKNIDIALFYFTDKRIAKALFEAKEAGVDIRIVLDKKQKNLSYGIKNYLLSLGREARGKKGNNLGRGSLAIRYHRISNGLMHNKFAIIGQNTLTGSFNWTQSAEKRNRENLVVMPFLVKDYSDEFERLWKDFELETVISKSGNNNNITKPSAARPSLSGKELNIEARPYDIGLVNKLATASEAVMTQRSAYQATTQAQGSPPAPPPPPPDKYEIWIYKPLPHIHAHPPHHKHKEDDDEDEDENH